MRFLAFKLILVSARRTATERILEFRRERRARMALKDLSHHLLEDIGQLDYYERREVARDRFASSTDPFKQ